MNPEQFGGLVRNVASAIGGWAVSQGYIDSETALTVTGAVVVVASTAWSWWIKRQSRQPNP